MCVARGNAICRLLRAGGTGAVAGLEIGAAVDGLVRDPCRCSRLSAVGPLEGGTAATESPSVAQLPRVPRVRIHAQPRACGAAVPGVRADRGPCRVHARVAEVPADMSRAASIPLL